MAPRTTCQICGGIDLPCGYTSHNHDSGDNASHRILSDIEVSATVTAGVSQDCTLNSRHESAQYSCTRDHTLCIALTGTSTVLYRLMRPDQPCPIQRNPVLLAFLPANLSLKNNALRSIQWAAAGLVDTHLH